jgi:hypothetical protein
MNKTIAKVGVAGLVLLGITECHMIVAPAVFADDSTLQTQTLELGKIRSLVGTEDSDHGWIDLEGPKFARNSDYEIITIAPWEKPEVAAKQMNVDQMKRVLRYAGFEGHSLRMAQAIIRLESNRRMYAHNPNHLTGDNSYGLFQINMFKDLEAQRLEQFGLSKNEDLFNPGVNARVAWEISDGGTDWSAWTTYPEAKKIVGQFSD